MAGGAGQGGPAAAATRTRPSPAPPRDGSAGLLRAPCRRRPVPSGELPRVRPLEIAAVPHSSFPVGRQALVRVSATAEWDLPFSCVWGLRARGLGVPTTENDRLSLRRIEKKRTIVPTLAGAIAGRGGREVDWEYFYGLLFTSENLKLVHIACHKKTTHGRSCDPGRIYKRPAKPRGRRAARTRP